MSPVQLVSLSQITKAVLRLFIVLGIVAGISGANSVPARAVDDTPPDSPEGIDVVAPSLFGVEMYHITAPFGLTQMAAAGAYWVRPEGVFWSRVQPVEGQPPDWSTLANLEQELANAQAEGMQVIMVVRSAPDWAQAIPGVSCGPIAQDKLADFGDFLFQLVDRYKDRVTYWEMWNEPDVDPDLVRADSPFGCWGDQDDEFYGGGYYAEMLKAAYPRIKQADPDAQVLLGGLLLDCNPFTYCPNERSANFLAGVLQNDGGSYFDGVSFHAFDHYLGELGKYYNEKWDSSWDTTGPVSIAKADYLRAVLAAAGYPDKYLLNTEAAVFCSIGCDAVYETTKANYLAQSYSSAFDSGVRANVWFASRSGFRNTDLLYSDLTPKPAYHAYQFSQSKLNAAEYLGRLSGYPGLSGYEFRRVDCPNAGEFCRLWVIWSLDGSDHTIELPDSPYAVYGVDGTILPANLTITVTLEPTYVELPPEFRIRMPVTVREYRKMQNGDFEAGLEGWSATSGGQEGLDYSLVSSNPTAPVQDSDIPIGSYSLLLGNTDYPCSSTGVPLGYASVEQSFSVPNLSSGSPLTLDFSYVIYTQDGNASSQYDRFEVYIDDGSGPTLVYWDGRQETSVSCSNWYRLPNSGWKQASIDLVLPVDYRGKLITVTFTNWNRFDHYFNTFTYLDEVKLNTGP